MTDVSKAPPDHAATILMIEDDPLVADVTTVMLEEEGYIVRRADTIDRALEILTIRLQNHQIGRP